MLKISPVLQTLSNGHQRSADAARGNLLVSDTAGMSLLGICFAEAMFTAGLEAVTKDLHAFRYIPNILETQLIGN